MKIPYAILVCSIMLTAGGCAAVPVDPDALAAYNEANDPGEPANRAIFKANQFVDRNVVKPIAAAYLDYVPDGARAVVHNFSSNLGEPKILVNDLLQGNFRRAWNTSQRFIVNSTVGGAGLFDVATMIDLPRHEADFGQTFGVWRIGPGPSVQLPLLGPSDLRDSVGTILGFVADPLSRIPGNTISTITAVGGGSGLLDVRSNMLATTDSLEKNSLDYYVTLRSVAAQRRAALVQDGLDGEVGGRVEVGPTIIHGQ